MPKLKEVKSESGLPNVFKSEVGKVEGARIVDAVDLENPAPNSTGSFSLDFDLVIPIPEGRITEIFGNEGAGKSSLALEIVGQALLKGKKALYVNMERALNRSLLETIRSIKPFLTQESSPLSVMWAPDGESALEFCRKWCVTNPNSILVLDSIDACVPAAVLAGEIADSHMGDHARLMSKAIRALISAVEENKVTFVCINQFRSKITSYGDPRTTSGGNTMKFYASQRIELMKPGKAEMIATPDGTTIGFTMRYKIIKNKCAPEGQEGEIPILYYNGIYREQEVIHLCSKFGLVKLGGAGGKQVYLPTLKEDGSEGESTLFSKFNASRRLILDQKLFEVLSAKLKDFLAQCRVTSNPIERLDEIHNAEGA